MRITHVEWNTWGEREFITGLKLTNAIGESQTFGLMDQGSGGKTNCVRGEVALKDLPIQKIQASDDNELHYGMTFTYTDGETAVVHQARSSYERTLEEGEVWVGL